MDVSTPEEFRPRPAPACSGRPRVRLPVMRYLVTMAFMLPCAPFLPSGHAIPLWDRSPANDDAPSAVTVPDTQVRVLTAANGRRHRTYIWSPPGDPPARGRPVIYVLDGETTFMLIRDGARSLAAAYPEVDLPVVVALGYDTPAPYSEDGLATVLRERSYDYTPAVPEALLGESFDGRPWPPTGGADAFLDFIEGRLKPVIEAEFPVDRSRQVLMGHSFGGLFTLHAFFRRPGSFGTYIASSPSTWYGQRYLDRAQQAFLAEFGGRLDGVRLLFTVGEHEQSRVPERGEHGRAEWLAAGRMVDGGREFAERMAPLRDRGLALEFRVYAGESHLSVKPPATDYGLRFALLPPAARADAPRDAPAQGADAAHPPYRLPASARWTGTGPEGDYAVSLVLPAFPHSLRVPDAGYPVVWFLGADDNFGVFADTLRRLEGGRMVEPAILVGLEALPSGPDAEDAVRRLAAVRAAVAPRLRQAFRIDVHRQILIGQGAHADTVLRTLHAEPGAFRTWAVLSPTRAGLHAVQWGPAGDLVERLAASRDAAGRVLLLSGDPAGDDFPGGVQGGNGDDVAAELARLAERLAPLRARGLDVETRVLAHEDDRFSIAAIAEALLFELDTSRATAPAP